MSLSHKRSVFLCHGEAVMVTEMYLISREDARTYQTYFFMAKEDRIDQDRKVVAAGFAFLVRTI